MFQEHIKYLNHFLQEDEEKKSWTKEKFKETAFAFFLFNLICGGPTRTTYYICFTGVMVNESYLKILQNVTY